MGAGPTSVLRVFMRDGYSLRGRRSYECARLFMRDGYSLRGCRFYSPIIVLSVSERRWVLSLLKQRIFR